MKIDPYAKELIVTFARALPPKLAYTMLEPIMDGRARGDIRKELKFSIEILRKPRLVQYHSRFFCEFGIRYN